MILEHVNNECISPLHPRSVNDRLHFNTVSTSIVKTPLNQTLLGPNKMIELEVNAV